MGNKLQDIPQTSESCQGNVEQQQYLSIICGSFPSPDWDHKCHIISKTQRAHNKAAHNKAFIEAMCSSLVFGLIAPSIEQKRVPESQTKSEAYDAFTPIMARRCKQAAKCIHLMCVEFGKCLTYFCCIEDNLEHKHINFELKS
jgi:hypothetical protein